MAAIKFCRNYNDNPKPMHVDINVLKKLSSPSDSDRDDGINDMYLVITSTYSNVISWYERKAVQQKRISKIFRGCGIFFIALASLWPAFILIDIFDYVSLALDLSQAGYLFAALGSAALAVEKFSGVSAAWIRFTKANILLRWSLDMFQNSWAMILIQSGASDPEARRKAQVELLKGEIAKLWKVVTEETSEWASRYLENFKSLQDSMTSVNAPPAPGVTLQPSLSRVHGDNAATT